MPQLITIHNNLYRINFNENRIDISYTKGATWVYRGRMGRMYGQIKDYFGFMTSRLHQQKQDYGHHGMKGQIGG